MSTVKVKASVATMRGARATLYIDQGTLAQAAGITRQALSEIESGNVVPREKTRAALQTALENRGIVFTNGDKPGFYVDESKRLIPT